MRLSSVSMSVSVVHRRTKPNHRGRAEEQIEFCELVAEAQAEAYATERREDDP